jgi:hypothetical protein
VTLQLSFVSHLSWNLRLVCRNFNDVLTPLLYRNIKLPGSLSDDEQTSCQVKANIRAHARRIKIEQELDWDEVSKLIRDCRFLQDLEWDTIFRVLSDTDVLEGGAIAKSISEACPFKSGQSFSMKSLISGFISINNLSWGFRHQPWMLALFLPWTYRLCVSLSSGMMFEDYKISL